MEDKIYFVNDGLEDRVFRNHDDFKKFYLDMLLDYVKCDLKDIENDKFCIGGKYDDLSMHCHDLSHLIYANDKEIAELGRAYGDHIEIYKKEY